MVLRTIGPRIKGPWDLGCLGSKVRGPKVRGSKALGLIILEPCGRPSLGSEYIPALNSVSHCDKDIFAQLDRIGLFMGLKSMRVQRNLLFQTKHNNV